MNRPIAVAVLLFAGLAIADRAAAPPLIGKVLKLQVVEESTLVTVGAGNDQGVDRTMGCAFVDAAGALTSTDCTIVRIDRRITLCRTKLSADAVKAAAGVKLTTR